MDNFTYQGWTFIHQQDGTVTINPSQEKQGSQGFASGSQKPLTVPPSEVTRLCGYLLTGQTDNLKVIDQIESLRQSQVAVRS